VRKITVNIFNSAFLAMFLLFVFWIGYIIINGNGGIKNRMKASRELYILETEIQTLEQESKVMEWEFEKLMSDKSYIESFARELGYKKKGEIIFRFMKNENIEE
jgi:cell division protein FtsB